MLEERIGYTFQNKQLLTRALTRKAYALEQAQQGITREDQEIYRTLGDAILKAILVDLLIREGCNTRDQITQRKIKMEEESGLAGFSKKLSVEKQVRLGKGEEKQGARQNKYVLAETLEAIVGAIYLDGGYYKAKETVEKWYEMGLFKEVII